MTIIDSQVHAYEANTPKRPWHSVPNWPGHVTGDEMVAAMAKVNVDGATDISIVGAMARGRVTLVRCLPISCTGSRRNVRALPHSRGPLAPWSGAPSSQRGAVAPLAAPWHGARCCASRWGHAVTAATALNFQTPDITGGDALSLNALRRIAHQLFDFFIKLLRDRQRCFTPIRRQ